MAIFNSYVSLPEGMYIYIYELQPKFTVMDSSIRGIYFLEIERGHGK